MNARLYLGVLMLCLAGNTWAGDRLEFGITFTDTGLIDHVSGLEWLDSALTDGNLDDLQLWLDAGWRIASEEEFFFLATRESGQAFGGQATSNLNLDEFQSAMARLSVAPGPGLFISGPWLCRPYGDPQDYCTSTTSYGGRFSIDVQASQAGDGTAVDMAVYITEVPMYGRFDCDELPPCTYEGRSLMVRVVNVPAPDTDNDGLANPDDNCLLVANADQRDTDGDGIGNICDPDLSGDCVVNFADLFVLRPLFFSADEGADFDGSGMVNFADLFILRNYFLGPPGPSGLPDNCDAGS